ncbi:MAG: peptide chain release factor-like protein [Planctomycetes bacterium]|nr:peptide chain release factor-like protein [Planctomycetota bacterium]
MDGRDYLLLDDAALLKQCAVDRYRSHGPGGQKRNKTSSAVRLRHGPTGLIVVAADERSQKVNRERALRRLREAIALNVRVEVDVRSLSPSPLLRARITEAGELHISRRSPHYYQIVREVLDVFGALDTHLRDTAGKLGVSTAQLVKFLREDPKLWKRANEMRTAAGADPLR